MRLPCGPDIKKLNDEAAVFLDTKSMKILSTNTNILRGSALRAHNSDWNVWKWNTNNTLLHEFTLKKNLKGVSNLPPMELKVHRTMTMIGADNQIYEEAFHDFAGVGKSALGAGARKIKGRAQELVGNINRAEFDERVRWGMSNGYRDRLGDANVNKAIQVQKGIIDRGTKRLKEAGLLDDIVGGPQFASTYFPRRYNKSAILNGNTNEAGQTFAERLKQSYVEQFPDMLESNINKQVEKTVAKINNMDDEFLELDALTTHIMHNGESASFFKQRQVSIDDADLHPWLSHDVQGTASSFGMRAEALAAMKEQFEVMGQQIGRPIEKIGDISKMLREEFEDKLAKLMEQPNSEARKKAVDKLRQSHRDANEEMLAQWRLATGQYGDIDTPHFRALRKYNAMTMLGGVSLASIPDVAMLVFKNGFGRTGREILRNMGETAQLSKASRAQMLKLAGVIDQHMDQVIRFQADPTFRVGESVNTVWEQKLNQLNNIFTSLTGINFINKNISTIGADMQANVMAEAFLKRKGGQALSQEMVTDFARMGIGTDKYPIIERNLKHVITKNGEVFHNISLWDAEAQELIGEAVLRSQTVLRPTAGDMPLWAMETGLQKLLFQFKSFLATAHNRILVAGAQRAALKGPAGALGSKELSGMVALIGMGAMSYMIREKIAGRGDQVDYSIDNLIVEGILRSGVGGLLSDPLALVIPGERSGRFAAWGAMGMIGGPSLSQAARAVEVLNGALDFELEEGELQKAGRLAPYNNLFYIQGLFNALGD